VNWTVGQKINGTKNGEKKRDANRLILLKLKKETIEKEDLIFAEITNED
jgi:hypothetical protein